MELGDVQPPPPAAAGAARGAEGADETAQKVPAELGVAAQVVTAVVEVEWYFQEPTTHQPAGPWTVEQLAKKWRRNQINGLTPVWRAGLQGGWAPLAEVSELKDALRALHDLEEADEDAVQPTKRRKRSPLDEVPLTHTYTSEHGELYVYDEVDEDWKSSEVYEALLAEEAEPDAAQSSKQPARPQSPEEAEQQRALEELLATASGPSGPAGPGSAGPRNGAGLLGKRRAGAAVGLAAASDIAALPSGGAEGSKGAGPRGGASGKAPSAPPPPAEDEEVEAKRQKRREYRERKKLKRQAGLFIKAQENPNVYVSGLPPDVTVQELEPVFKRAGVLKVDPDTGGPKIRIYAGAEGSACKGDALVSFANAASVELAVKFLHEFELRPQCRICVQQADFDEHERDPRLSKAQLQELASSRKADKEREKYIAAKNAQKEAISWSGEMDDGTGRRIVVLKHMFSLEEAEREGADFYRELAEEVQEECQKVGQVVKVTPLERHRLGIVCVKFKASAEAEECIRVMDGRYFAGRTVEASFYDGRTDLRALGAITPAKQSPPARPKVLTNADSAAATSPTPAPATQVQELRGTTHADGVAANGSDGASMTPADADEAPCPKKAVSPTVPSAPPQTVGADGKTWDDWLNDQSSSDEEMQVRTEE